MANDEPKEDKDALDALELEAKEFDKVGRMRPRQPSLRTDDYDRMPRSTES